jgi:ABC-type nitrate/sulfonate/bicarbonate transport system substrate-binding protein
MKLPGKVYVVLSLLVLPVRSLAQEHMIGYAGFAGFQVSMWAAKDLGLLKKYGLQGETILVPGTSRQIQALVGDSIQFAHVDAAGHIRAVMRGADIVMVTARDAKSDSPAGGPYRKEDRHRGIRRRQ